MSIYFILSFMRGKFANAEGMCAKSRVFRAAQVLM